jgi:SAM-dependent methyltransferase
MTTKSSNPVELSFLDMQGEIGITKHIGGFAATDDLLALCHIQEACEVLNVGCGIGVGSAYVASKYGCHVVAVDISEKMIAWARRRAAEDGVEDRIEFRVADVCALPFDRERFDLVFVESVLSFVTDKRQAINECIRVTRPGGYVGLNEAFFEEEVPPEMAARVAATMGAAVLTAAEWQALWQMTGLEDRMVKLTRVDAGAEVKSRIEWIGWRWLLKAWGRVLWLVISQPAARHSVRDQLDTPPSVMKQVGYGLFIGRKAAVG